MEFAEKSGAGPWRLGYSGPMNLGRRTAEGDCPHMSNRAFCQERAWHPVTVFLYSNWSEDMRSVWRSHLETGQSWQRAFGGETAR